MPRELLLLSTLTIVCSSLTNNPCSTLSGILMRTARVSRLRLKRVTYRPVFRRMPRELLLLSTLTIVCSSLTNNPCSTLSGILMRTARVSRLRLKRVTYRPVTFSLLKRKSNEKEKIKLERCSFVFWYSGVFGEIF